mmetsp:Transcript_42105/g.97474  ORF Transcript_42105/g.97474 Transcript_42105/m.97474 type:complete len:257 (-) Transcript_42105:624-1394(-)
MFVTAEVQPHGLHRSGPGSAEVARQRVAVQSDVVRHVPHVLLERVSLLHCRRRRWWRGVPHMLLGLEVLVYSLQCTEGPGLANHAPELTDPDIIEAVAGHNALEEVLIGQVVSPATRKTQPELVLHPPPVILPLHVPRHDHGHCHRPLLTQCAVEAVVPPLDALLFPAGLQLQHPLVDVLVTILVWQHKVRQIPQLVVQKEREVGILSCVLHLPLRQLRGSPVGARYAGVLSHLHSEMLREGLQTLLFDPFPPCQL